MAFSLNTKANLIGVGALFIVAGYIAYDLTTTVEVEPCSTSYPSAVSMDLNAGGDEVLSPIALQARSGSQDWGLLERLEIERDATAPASKVLRVKLTKDDVASSFNAKRGIGFPWRPSRLDGADAVCFRYDVMFSDDFDFSTGGILPGLVSEPPREDDTAVDAFADKKEKGPEIPLRAHLGWSTSGHAQLMTFDPTGQTRALRIIMPAEMPLKKGRWQRIEAEIKLNDAGRKNGVARLWVDGELAMERDNLNLRPAPGQAFESVLYSISHGKPFGSGALEPSGDGTVTVTPLELSWR